MKKLAAAVAGVTALIAYPAIAGLNPFDPGLPQGWTSTVYTTVVGDAAVLPGTIDGTAATTKLSVLDSYTSAMCVECHSRNPSDRITAPSTHAGGIAILPGTHQGSHTVAGPNAAGRSNSGGGWNPARVAGQYEKTTLWLPGASAGKGFSKYGTHDAVYSDNDLLAAAAASVPGDVTCESCHNILVNRGDQLLLGAYADGPSSAAVGAEAGARNGDQICVACHGKGAETYAAFHANGNMRNFNNTAMKRHHILSDGAAAMVDDLVNAVNYDPDVNAATNDSVMWAPNFSYEQGNVGTYNAWVYTNTVASNNTVPYIFRDRWNVTGAGTLAAAIATGDIPTTTEVMCVSCHRPHNAETTTGAFVLRRGTLATAFPAGGAATGIQRQSEFDNTFATKLYVEYVPLCKGCHTGYGN
ncbi:hypothetical protein EPN96_00860 [bacterium]|nr:MAG: hypothetical protein EPN96_00860 [bacterium]